MDNVGIVVEDLKATIEFFASSASSSKGKAQSKASGPVVSPDWRSARQDCDDVYAGRPQPARTLALSPATVADHRNAPVNALGYLRVMFAVDDIDETLERLYKRGAQLVGEVVRYKDAYRLCYIRGPRGFSSGWPSNWVDVHQA